MVMVMDKPGNKAKKNDTSFKKGKSGNSKGRPIGSTSVKNLIKHYGKNYKSHYIKDLFDILKDGGSAPKDKIACLKILLSYEFGQPTQAIEHSGNKLTFIIKKPDEDIDTDTNA
jgi:hypothetical protein